MRFALGFIGLLAAGCAASPSATTVPPAATAAASAEVESVLKTVDTFLLALGNGDRTLQKSVELPDGVIAFARITKNAQGTVRRMPQSQLQDSPGGDPFIEMYWNPEVQLRGPFAQVWAPYVLLDNGAAVHCGIDAFQLVKLEGQWKIHASLSSMEPDACDELGWKTAAGLRPRDGWRETPNQ